MVLKVDAIDAKRNNHEVVEKYSSKLEKISVFSDLSQKAVNTEEIMKEILNYTQDNNDDERRLKISKHNAEMFRRDGDIKSAEEIETRIKNGQEKLEIEERIKSAGIETIKQYQIGEKDYDHTTDKTLTESQRMLKDDLDKKRCEISLKIERYKDKVKSTRESYARYRMGIPFKYNQSNEEMQAGMIEQKRLNREYAEKVEKMETELELIDLLYNMDLNSFLSI